MKVVVWVAGKERVVGGRTGGAVCWGVREVVVVDLWVLCEKFGLGRSSGATLGALVGYGRSKVGKWVLAHVEKGTLFNNNKNKFLSFVCLMSVTHPQRSAYVPSHPLAIWHRLV